MESGGDGWWMYVGGDDTRPGWAQAELSRRRKVAQARVCGSSCRNEHDPVSEQQMRR